MIIDAVKATLAAASHCQHGASSETGVDAQCLPIKLSFKKKSVLNMLFPPGAVLSLLAIASQSV